jgi:ABC-2 type transport system ATP-binding protein
MTYAIETHHLSRQFGKFHAVQDVNLRVERGEIYGFLGLNGAGKTTTIRMLLGMIRPREGNVKILGQSVGAGGRGPWKRVGHLVESPAAYPELSVRENLEMARRLHGIRDSGIVDQTMSMLRIEPYADRKAGTLSSGNFQRLGLARALLHHPELLILDEPANALDPAGIVEIRELLESLAGDLGITIFMSSHILSEVDRLAQRIGIIHKGRLIEELDVERLEQIRARQLVVETRNREQAKSALAGYEMAELGENRLALKDRRAVDEPEAIASLLVKAGVPPLHLAIEQENLEEYFLRLTRE